MNQTLTLTRAIQRTLSIDYHLRAEASTEEIGAWLETPQDNSPYLKGAYTVFK